MAMLWIAVALTATVNIAAAKKSDFLDEMRAVLPLTAENYKDNVEGSKIGWILAFGDAPEVADLGEVVDKIEGLSRIAFIDTAKEATLLDYLDLKADSAPKFRAKGIGVDAKFLDFETAEEAASHITENIPEGLVEVLPDPSAFQPFLQQTLQTQSLPVMLLSNKADVPKLFVKLSMWMGEPRFKYAVFPNPNEEVMKQFGAKKLPYLLLMVPQPEDEKGGQKGQFRFAPVPYPRKQFGGLKFKNVIRFLATVQNELEQSGFFKKQEEFDIPGKKSADKKEKKAPAGAVIKTQPLFEYTAETADACSDSKLGLCVIALLDGSPLNPDKEAQLKILEDVQKRPANKGRALHFMWVDLTCHPKFGEFFGKSLENVPTVIAVSPKKGLSANMMGSFQGKAITTFINGVLQGKNRIGPMPGDKKVPTISADENCADIHASMMPVEEEDDGMGDIMAEMAAEAEATEKAAAEERANMPSKEDIELEEKKKKAQIEMDRLNKMSNKGNKKKKKKKNKKKRKGKKKKGKDEL